MIKPFPKIFTIGQDYISKIFDSEVEITEKIDGSQFSFGKIDGKICFRSKGKEIYTESVDKMFKPAVECVLSIESKLPRGLSFYCEYLMRPKHNVLSYERTPKNNLILFGVGDETEKFENDYSKLLQYGTLLDIEVVPLIFKGVVAKIEDIFSFLELKSVLGNVCVEGIVIKNYSIPFLLGGQPIPIMMGKYVSEKFKEKLDTDWKKENTGKGRFETYKDSFKTEARWNKAIQHLREQGELENEPKDIGKLIQEIKKDISEEEKENIMKHLWEEFSPDIFRKAVQGFPEWYKAQLLKRIF